MMRDERESKAGPIAALRITGHPEMRPLSEKPSEAEVVEARSLLLVGGNIEVPELLHSIIGDHKAIRDVLRARV
jgi:hypothetical protein